MPYSFWRFFSIAQLLSYLRHDRDTHLTLSFLFTHPVHSPEMYPTHNYFTSFINKLKIFHFGILLGLIINSRLGFAHAWIYAPVFYIKQGKKDTITGANNSIPQEMCSTYEPSVDVFVICKFKEIILACSLPVADAGKARSQAV